MVLQALNIDYYWWDDPTGTPIIPGADRSGHTRPPTQSSGGHAQKQQEPPRLRELLSCMAFDKKRAPSPACESAPWHTSQSNVKDVIQVYKAVAR